MYYQPIYDTRAGKLRSCEALVRMTDPELGPVSPEEFIKVAERTGTISTIGAIVFEKVCAFIADKQPSRYGVDFVEVNVSPIQCMDQNLVSEFQAIMKRYRVQAEQIVLEITESAVIRSKGRVSGIIKGLYDAGFRFALDDFGTARQTIPTCVTLRFPSSRSTRASCGQQMTTRPIRRCFIAC
jgi:EAL domain-containing protein (putative c-di-GMP-specific phosphodiesterase class I)